MVDHPVDRRGSGHVDLHASSPRLDLPEEVRVPGDQRAPGLDDQPGWRSGSRP